MAEVGLPDVEIGSGVGLVAPAGTPPAIIETLNREIAAIIADKGFHERMAKIGVDVVGTTRGGLRQDHARRLRQVGARS